MSNTDTATVGNRPKHSPIGASSMSRWSKCPGSIRLSRDLPNSAGIAAQRGTVAHEVIGLAMDEAFGKNVPTTDILRDYWDAITVYSSYIEKIKRDEPAAAIHIEHKFDLTELFPNLYGQGDCVIWNPYTQVLRMIDYKHGENIVVEVERNKQLSYYGLGAIMTLDYRPKWVELTIVQPRAYHPAGPIRSWRVPITYFIEFRNELLAAAKATQEPDAPLSAGDHCIFCPAKSVCTEKHNVAVGAAKREFNFYTDPKQDFADDPIATGASECKAV